MRWLLEFASLFDWISPLLAIGDNIIHGRPFGIDTWTIAIPFDRAVRQGWSPWDIERILSKNGVRSWGGLFHRGEYNLNVGLEQARWAEYVLLHHGVPIHQRSANPPAPHRTARNEKLTERMHPLEYSDHIERFLDSLFHPPTWLG